MRLKDLNKKYGSETIEYIFAEGYLDCFAVGLKDGRIDIPEKEVVKAIGKMEKAKG